MTPVELRAVLLERLPADPKWRAWVEGVVERVGTVEDPRIARIAALCDEAQQERDEWVRIHPGDDGVMHAVVDVADVRAVLGEVRSDD